MSVFATPQTLIRWDAAELDKVVQRLKDTPAHWNTDSYLIKYRYSLYMKHRAAVVSRLMIWPPDALTEALTMLSRTEILPDPHRTAGESGSHERIHSMWQEWFRPLTFCALSLSWSRRWKQLCVIKKRVIYGAHAYL